MDSFRSALLSGYIHEFHRLKSLADKGMAQVNPENFFSRSDAEANSIALLVKHMAGNMRSRWTDFLTTDGEKPDRHRDEEFEIREGDTREKLLEDWDQSWEVLFDTLQSLSESDLEETITIREEEHTVWQAILRQISHYAYHVGQIVMLAKELRSGEWQSLSIPRGKSEEFRKNPKSYLGEQRSDKHS